MRSLALAMVLLTPLSLLSQEVVFKDLNIHPSNKLLYSVEVPAPGTPGYTTSVLADLNTGEMEPLTFYPERAVFFSGLRTLQLQNRLGFTAGGPPVPLVSSRMKDFSRVRASLRENCSPY
jgi:hypothetical protein